MIDVVRVSKKGRDQLLTLKRRTGITTWNVLCRWAFLVSIREATRVRADRAPGESPIEMTWRTFAGEYEDIYLALLKDRCERDGLEPTERNLAKQLRLHVHRGIGYLAGDPNLRSIADLVEKALVVSPQP